MIKYFTPDNCPLQAGSVLHNTYTNTDYIVMARRLDGDTYSDDLVAVIYDNDSKNMHWLTGEVFANGAWEYYPDWPNTSVSKPCYLVVEEPGISDIEFAQAVFDIAKKLPGVSKLYKVNKYGTSVWDDNAHAIIQENIAAIVDGLQKCVEENNV